MKDLALQREQIMEPNHRKKKFLQKAIKHPGRLIAEAKRSGHSKMQQAEHDAHSSNPHTRARGILGERLIRGDFRK